MLAGQVEILNNPAAALANGLMGRQCNGKTGNSEKRDQKKHLKPTATESYQEKQRVNKELL